ncbi:heterokaryon incompatibility protein-domain-containing protein [Usnea florida]
MTASSKRPHQPSNGARERMKQCPSPDLGPYEYTTINKEASEIRLMTLLPGVFGSEIRITMQNHVFTESQIPVYEALSYGWGSNEKPAKIRIKETGGDRMLAVTSNLAEALQYLRYENRPRVLWIDAICVNQQNIPERGHQVSRMADIYRSASPVLIWLGPEFASSDVAMRELSDLGSTVRINWGTAEVTPLSGDSYTIWHATPYRFSRHGSVLRSIEVLLDRLWFKRLWIWQEVRLAKTGAQVLCGDKTMLWETFRNAIYCFRLKYENWGNNFVNLINHISNLCNYTHPHCLTLDILEATKYCTYSDPRDRVYAMLSLIYPHEIAGFDSDYSKSTEEVFRTFVMNHISTKGNLNLLSQCELREPKSIKVPSWVPDWTVPRDCKPLRFAKACFGAKGEADFNDTGILRVTACCVGTVDSVHDIGKRRLPSIARRLWRVLGREEDIGGARDLKMDALCRTLCCNEFSESHLPPSQSRAHSQDCQKLMFSLIKGVTSSHYRDRNYLLYNNFVRAKTKNRAFFTTKEGNIGLAPRRTKSGDQLCIVLGCQFPLVFRKNKFGNYTVVGECYLDGIMEGAGLLGKLPSNWQRVDRYDPDLKNYYDAFINRDTDIVQIEDPRLGPLPPGWRIADHIDKHMVNWYTNEAAGIFDSDFDPRMSPEALRARGIDLQEYRLV